MKHVIPVILMLVLSASAGRLAIPLSTEFEPKLIWAFAATGLFVFGIGSYLYGLKVGAAVARNH